MSETLRFNPEENNELKERDERASFAEGWRSVVLDEAERPAEFNDNEALKNWLSDSVGKEAHELAQAWGLLPEQDAVEQMRAEQDAEAKTERQRQVISDLEHATHNIKEGFSHDEAVSDKWMFLPKKMKEQKLFNCSGISLVAEQALTEAGIETRVGAPAGHVINIARLANGEIWYLDFRNDKYFDITNNEQIDMHGIQTFRIDSAETEYQLIPVLPKNHHAALLLGNLSALNQEALETEKGNDADSEAAKHDAEIFRKNHETQFNNIDFGDWQRRLFPNFYDMQNSEEMNQERKRIDGMRGDEYLKEARAYATTLGRNGERTLQAELQEKSAAFEQLIREGNLSSIEAFTPATREFLSILISNLSEFREHHETNYKAFVERLVYQITHPSASAKRR